MPRGVRAGSRQVALQSVSSIDMVGYRHVGLPVAAEIQVIAAVANGEHRHPGVAGQDVGSAAAVEMLVMQVDDDAAVLPMCQVFGGEAVDLPAAPLAVSVGGGEQVERPAFVCEFRVGEETHAPPAGRVRRVGDAHGGVESFRDDGDDHARGIGSRAVNARPVIAVHREQERTEQILGLRYGGSVEGRHGSVIAAEPQSQPSDVSDFAADRTVRRPLVQRQP